MLANIYLAFTLCQSLHSYLCVLSPCAVGECRKGRKRHSLVKRLWSATEEELMWV